MRLLVASQYFPPEVGATQNRMAAFVDGLRERGHHVTVVCEQPNHPKGVFHPGYGRRPLAVERGPGGGTMRLWVKASPEKSTLNRAAFYGTFAAGAALVTATRPRHDVVFATSPPLPGAFAVARMSSLRGIPFVLDVRDLWPAAAEALGEVSDPRLLAMMERAERWLYRNAAHVTATTQPFCDHIDRVAGRPISSHLPNGASDVLLAEDAKLPTAEGNFIVGYVGNLGVAQGLGIVLDAAERLRGASVEFRLVGAGPRERELRERVAARALGEAIRFRAPVPLGEVAAVMRGCHALLVPLRDSELLGSFVPSKLYDAMAVGRPVIGAAGDQTASLIAETGCGLSIPPENGDALAGAVQRLMGDRQAAEAMASAGLAAAPAHLRSATVGALEAVLQEAARDVA